MATKPLRYSKHALTVLAERELSHEWVARTIREPEWTRPEPGSPYVERRFRSLPERDGRVLRVVVVETEYEIRIVTVFLDRRARRPS